MNIKFKKFANLNWMKKEFDVDPDQLMDFQMMSPDIGMVAFHKKKLLRIVAFTYEFKEK